LEEAFGGACITADSLTTYVGLVCMTAAVCAEVYDLGVWIVTGSWGQTTLASLLGTVGRGDWDETLLQAPMWLSLVVLGAPIGLIGLGQLSRRLGKKPARRVASCKKVAFGPQQREDPARGLHMLRNNSRRFS
jgi:hypothetical protein